MKVVVQSTFRLVDDGGGYIPESEFPEGAMDKAIIMHKQFVKDLQDMVDNLNSKGDYDDAYAKAMSII